jgi:hypothetical protein
MVVSRKRLPKRAAKRYFKCIFACAQRLAKARSPACRLLTTRFGPRQAGLSELFCSLNLDFN